MSHSRIDYSRRSGRHTVIESHGFWKRPSFLVLSEFQSSRRPPLTSIDLHPRCGTYPLLLHLVRTTQVSVQLEYKFSFLERGGIQFVSIGEKFGSSTFFEWGCTACFVVIRLSNARPFRSTRCIYPGTALCRVVPCFVVLSYIAPYRPAFEAWAS